MKKSVDSDRSKDRIKAAPRWLRSRILLRLARQLVRSSYRGSRAIAHVKRGTARIDLRASIFCSVRESVPQPVQQQSRDYFAGQWKFKWLGRDSPLSTGGPREGTATFRPVVDGKFLELVTEGKSESGAYRELGYLGYDSEKKSVTLFEARGNGIALLCVGDWSSPVSIRFSVAPVQAGGQTLRLKRTINVVAAHSWTMVEELSVDGGPFQRLGNAIYTKVGAEGAKE